MSRAQENQAERSNEDPVLTEERDQLRRSREYLHLMREDVLSLRAMGGDRVSEEYLKAELYHRAEALKDIPDTPLFFGRLDYAGQPETEKPEPGQSASAQSASAQSASGKTATEQSGAAGEEDGFVLEGEWIARRHAMFGQRILGRDAARPYQQVLDLRLLARFQMDLAAA